MKLRELYNRQLNEATLRRGSRGDDVKALQRALGIRPADGIFGPQTERAVRNFQKAAGATVDGIAGGQTQAALRKFQEEPGASRDYGNIRPGTDWSDLDPGEIEVTPAAEPEEPETGGRGNGDEEAARRAADNNGQPRGTEDDAMSQQVVEPDNGWQDVDPQFAQGLPDGYEIKRGRVDGEDMFLLVRPNGTEETSNDLQGLVRVAQTDIEADAERAAGQGVDGQDAQRAQGMGQERPADPASTMRDNEIEGTGQWRITPSPNNPTTFVVRRPDGSIDTSFNSGNPFTRSKADGQGQDYIDRLNRQQGLTTEPEVTGSGRGDGNAEVAARREEAAKQATEEFVRAQVAELTRIRSNYPEDQLIRKITQDAVEQGLNDGWTEEGGMAAYIAELVPTVDRAAPQVDTTAPEQPGAGTTGGDSGVDTTATDDAAVNTAAPERPANPANADAAAVAQQISRFQQAYGSGTDGQVPTLFRDKFLNPAIDELGLTTMQALSSELQGEIPQAVARVIIQRIEQVYGNEQELQQAVQDMRGDSDPEIQDQVRALEVLIPLLTKLRKDEARAVESLDRILKLAGV
jgi:peptidoglycan hydrolase-like protein with peptidoglycan-binding domain